MDNKNVTWLANVGVVQIGEGFTDYNEVIHRMIELTEASFDCTPTAAEYEELKFGLAGFNQTYRPFDTSVGGSEVFNPYWQFGLDDDIIHPINDLSASKDGTKGLGSIYSEMIYDTQRVLWVSCGVPRFSGLKAFFSDSNASLAQMMKDGKMSLGSAIGELIGKTGKLMINIAFLPISASIYIGDFLTSQSPVTKYYDFKPAMPLYFRLVNGIFSSLSVSLGIYGYDNRINNTIGFHTGGIRESALRNLSEPDLPEIMRNGPDIFAIMSRRNERMKVAMPGGNIKTEYELLESQAQADVEESEEDIGFWKKFGMGFADEMEGINNFIGFRVEKNADASESLNNESGESEIAGSINSMVSQQRNMMFKIQGGKIVNLPDWLSGAIGNVKDLFTSAAGALGTNGMIQMATGNGFYDIPHDWKNSTFNKNQSFSIPLRARYGDPVSILQSLYLPLALWLAAASPRAIGSNMYTSPFLVQAFCKGLFSIPLGMVESMSIKRGEPEFGWNRVGLPLSLDLDITIKDLTPTMFISLTSNEESIFSLSMKNTSMLDYLATLCGIGLFGRNSGLQKRWSRFYSAWLRLENTLFNPTFWGQLVADNSGVFKGLYQMSPWATGPERFPPVGRL